MDSSIPELAEKSHAARRIEYVLDAMLADVKGEDKKSKRFKFLLRKIVAEATDEIDNVPPEMLEYYFKRAAHMMFWAATGTTIENMPMPPGFRPPAEISAPDMPTMSEIDKQAWAAIETEDYARALAEGRAAEMQALEEGTG